MTALTHFIRNPYAVIVVNIFVMCKYSINLVCCCNGTVEPLSVAVSPHKMNLKTTVLPYRNMFH